jgi:hypothetical protein
MDNRPSPQELIAEYRMAFRNCNPGTPDPNIVYDHGWFKFVSKAWSDRNYRRADFYKMLVALRHRSNSSQIGNSK